MKSIIVIIPLAFITCFPATAQDAKIVTDCTVVYNVSVIDSKADASVVKSMDGSTKILYIKGSKSRSELVTPTFTQTTLYDSKTDSTIILRELGNARYITYLRDSIRKEQNAKYVGIQFTETNERKTILGYDCRQLVARLANGFAYNIFYATIISPSDKLYEYQFKDVPGLVLEYEAQSEDAKTKIKYSAVKINLLPVPVAKFDIPKNGYRIL